MRLWKIVAAALLPSPAFAMAQSGAPHEAQARAIYERTISFRTAEGHAQVPAMAQYLSDTLKAGGVAADDISLLPSRDTTAMLVRIPGRDKAAKPILFSAHMDVVDARAEDWTRDPFTLVEENGYFFGRGTSDNKAGVVALASAILRFRKEGRTPRRR